MILSGELQLAEKWNAVINEGLVGRVDRVGKVERLSEAKSRKAGVVG
jgi:hypothetical protein